MKRSAWCMVLTLVCGLSTLPSSAQAPDRNEIIRQARQHYYSLRGEGLMEFSCKVQLKLFNDVKPQLATEYRKQRVNDLMQQQSDKVQAALTKDPLNPEKVAAGLGVQ